MIRCRASIRAAWISARQPPPARRATRAGDDRFADREAADVDPVDLLVVGGELSAEPAVEARRVDLDVADAGDLVVVEVQHDLGVARLPRRLFPAGFRDRQAGVAQVEQRRRLAGIRRHRLIGRIERDRAVDPVGREIEAEPALRLVVEAHADPVHRMRPALRMEGDGWRRAWRARCRSGRCLAGARRCGARSSAKLPSVSSRSSTTLPILAPDDRRFGAVVDRVELQVVEQRQLEMQLRLGAAGDLRRVEADRVRIMQRLLVESPRAHPAAARRAPRSIVSHSTGSSRLVSAHRAAGELHPLEAAGGRHELQHVVAEGGRAGDLPHRRQALEIGDRQVVVLQPPLGVRHSAGMGNRVEIEGELHRGFVEHAVVDIGESPAPAAGTERLRPKFAEAGHRHLLQRAGKVAFDAAGRAGIGCRGDQLGRDALKIADDARAAPPPRSSARFSTRISSVSGA